MEFGTGYFNAMDREYFANDVEPESHGHNCGDHHHTQDVGVKAGDLGMSFQVGMGSARDVAGIASKIRAGAKTIELGFRGTPGGKSSAGNMSPEYFGKLQRQALREAATVNRVDFTLHTNVGVSGLAGQTQNGFDKNSKERSLDEIKRAIDFAQDVSHGGAIVVHTGEKGRPLSRAKWNTGDEKLPSFMNQYKNKFESFEGESRSAPVELVDSRTGSYVSRYQPGKGMQRPKFKRYAPGTPEWEEFGGKEYFDEENKVWVKPDDYIDYLGNKVTRRSERVVLFDKDTKDFKTEYYGEDEARKDAREMEENARNFIKKYGSYNDNPQAWDKYADPYMFQDGIKNARSLGSIKVDVDSVLIIQQLENQAAQARGFVGESVQQFDEMAKSLKELKKAEAFYQKLDDSLPEDEKYKLMRSVSDNISRMLPELNSSKSESVIDLIKKEIESKKSSLRFMQNRSAAQSAQVAETLETIKYIQSSEDYALNEAFDSYARAGIHAMRKSDILRNKKKLKKDIFVALENLFPEAYGSHPVELVKLVKESRSVMAQKLKDEFGKSDKEANKLARNHLKATLDLGHLNIWRKFWKSDPSKSVEQNDQNFDKWALEMVDYMAKEDIIGHVHVDDNYGYGDEHLAPGEGNAPIKEMIKVLKKNGYDGELIVEPGADFDLDKGAFSSLSKAWKYLGSPIGGTMGSFANRGAQSWSNMQYGHFGQNSPAYFTFGSYSPSEDFKLWSGVPLD